jgi:hypothetical protein
MPFVRQQNLGDSRWWMAEARAAAAYQNQAEDGQNGPAEGTDILHDW